MRSISAASSRAASRQHPTTRSARATRPRRNRPSSAPSPRAGHRPSWLRSSWAISSPPPTGPKPTFAAPSISTVPRRRPATATAPSRSPGSTSKAAACPATPSGQRPFTTQALLDEEPDAAFGLARLATAAGDEAGAKSFTAQGIVFLRLRAERSATAASALATRYATGDGLPRDLGRARVLFERAIALGQTTAAVSLGTKLVEGTALPADPATAKALLVEAEAAGSVDAARTLLADAAGPQTFKLSPDEIDLLVRHLEGIDDIPGMLGAQEPLSRRPWRHGGSGAERCPPRSRHARRPRRPDAAGHARAEAPRRSRHACRSRSAP